MDLTQQIFCTIGLSVVTFASLLLVFGFTVSFLIHFNSGDNKVAGDFVWLVGLLLFSVLCFYGYFWIWS